MIPDVLKESGEKMDKTVENFRRALMSVRAGRATPALLDKVRVDYYGAPTPVGQLATISVPEPRLLVIQPWDKSMIGAVEKAIQKSDLGLTPASDGTVVRLAIPQLTEQRRAELVRSVRRMAEEERVAVRNVRREARELIEALQKEGEVAEDDAHRGQDDLQHQTDRATEQIARLLDAKEKEIMEV